MAGEKLMEKGSTFEKLTSNIRIPLLAAPLFIISVPKLVIAQCKSGVIGSFPALNARETESEHPLLEKWLKEITEELDKHNQKNPEKPAAPFAVNQIVHRSNSRLQRDIDICVKWEVPLWITSLGAREEVNQAAHSCGAIVLHDVINNAFAKKAIAKGADGLIAVASGAGGHAGNLSPFALIDEIRSWFNGPLMLSGSISTGKSLMAALILGADLAYVGTPFIATKEANANEKYKDMLIKCNSENIINSSLFTGVSGNYLGPSIAAAGLDVSKLPEASPESMNFDELAKKPKAWKEIWGSGQGINPIKSILSTEELVQRIENEFQECKNLFKKKTSVPQIRRADHH